MDTLSWLRWHSVELGVAVAPSIAAVTVSPWWWAVTGLVVAEWGRQGWTDRQPTPPPRDDERDDESHEPADLTA